MDLKESLKKKLNEKELESLPKSFDTIGTIAILDFPPELKKKEKIIAETLMSINKSIKTVLKKQGKIRGRLRTRKLKFVAGLKTKETIHKESNCLLKLDVEKCYFSPRLSNDRIDVMKQVKPGEKILVMFSGIAPYPIVIAKNSKAKEIYGIELNRIASKYAQENIKINKLSNCFAVQGDVKKIIPKLKTKFDRVVMARPQLKDDFLDSALKASKEGTIIHFYDFLREDEMPEAAFRKISSAVERLKKTNKRIDSWKMIRWKKALEIGPRKWRIRVDFFVF